MSADLANTKGLYLFVYGLEVALLLVFGAVDGKQYGVVGGVGKVVRAKPHKLD
jgi:hypothetical protein